MGEMADEIIDAMLMGDWGMKDGVSNANRYSIPKPYRSDPDPYRNKSKSRYTSPPPKFNGIDGDYGRTKGEKKMYNRPNGYPEYKQDVKVIFKVHNMEHGAFGIVVEQGLQKESLAVSFDRSKFRSRGFIVDKNSIFKSGESETKEVISMHSVFNGLCTLLNNLYSADLLTEDKYNSVLDAYEPFLYEALDFSEIEAYLEPAGINAKKKKRISRRGRSNA